MTWRQYRNGKRWRVLETGEIEVEGEGVIRTPGEPKTMRNILELQGDAIADICARYSVPVSWVLGMIPIEARMHRAESPVMSRFMGSPRTWKLVFIITPQPVCLLNSRIRR